MPASYTHYLVARESLLALPPRLQTAAEQSLPLYFFGAQGADFCFFYPSFRPKAKNLGSFLHREGGVSTFQILKTLSKREPYILAYALGYVTHYATDCIFHPYVYATAGNSALRHSRLETILDIRFKKQAKAHGYDGYFRKRLSDQEKDALFLIYTALALKAGFPPPKKPSFLRSISLFNAYLSLPHSLFDGTNAEIRAVAANEEKRTWQYPANPTIQSADSADELFARACATAAELMQTFFYAAQKGLPLDPTSFGKSFLTGL